MKNLDNLNEEEKQIVLEAIKAVVFGPFYNGGNALEKYFNLEQNEIDKINNLIDDWPEIEKYHKFAFEIINRSLHLLLQNFNYYHDFWDDYLSVSKEKIEEIYYKLTLKFNEFTKDQKRVSFECLNAIAFGPFCSDDLVHTLLGYYKSEIKEVISDWDSIDEECINVRNIIRSVLGHIYFFPNGFYKEVPDKVFSEYFSVSPSYIEDLFYKFIGERKSEPEKWDGIVRGIISKKARDKWNKISVKVQNGFLTNVWCPKCSENTTITQFEGFNDKYSNNLILHGSCVKCFGGVELEVDPENVSKEYVSNLYVFLKREIIS